MPPKSAKGSKPGTAKGSKPGTANADAEQRPVNFKLQIICEPTPLLETSTEAFDCQFTFHFPGEAEPETTPLRSTWEGNEWSNEYLRNADRELLLQLAKEGSVRVTVEQKSCPFSYGKEDEETGGKPPGSAKGKKKDKAKAPAEPLAPGEKAPPERPAQLDNEPTVSAMTVRLHINSLIMSPDPVVCSFDRAGPSGHARPPASLASLKMVLTAEGEPLLSEELKKSLLPMQITVIGAEGMPQAPFPFEEMGGFYKPVRAKFGFYNKQVAALVETEPEVKKKGSRPPSAADKKKGKGKKEPEPEPEPEQPEASDKDPLEFEEDEPPPPPPPEEEEPMIEVETDGLPHSTNPRWEHSETIFLGELDLTALAYHLEHKPLCVEVHDRDISDEGLNKAVIMTRGAPASIERMIMVSPDDYGLGEQDKGEPAAEEAAGEEPAKGKKGGDKKKGKKGKDSSRSHTPSEVSEAAMSAALIKKKEREEALAKKNIVGVAAFRLVDIFRGSQDFTLTSPILPKNPPRGTKRKPFQMDYNPYGDEASISIRVRLATKLPYQPTFLSHTYNRLVLRFRYNNIPLLEQVCSVFKQANLRALDLTHHPWTDLSTIRLTDEERAEKLRDDILTGVQVIDSQYRVMIIEGLATNVPGARAMAELIEAIPRMTPNNDDFKLLSNPDITFYERLYIGFDVDIKKIKLIQPLSKIASTRNIHLNKKIPPACYRAFQALDQLQLANRLRMAKVMNMFPTIHELLSLEKWYGDFVSDADLGLETRKKRNLRAEKIVASEGTARTALSAEFSIVAEDNWEDEQEAPEEAAHRVDCYNRAYEEALPIAAARRNATNFVKGGITALRDLETTSLLKTRAFKRRPADVYELLPSATRPLEVDYEAMELDDKRREEERVRGEAYKERERGFRTHVHEPWNEHPKRPHPTRVWDLKQPWVENELRPEHQAGERVPGMNVPTRLGGEFGMPDNAEWGKSVFVGTAEGLELERVASIKRAKEEWREKLVVDDPLLRLHLGAEHRKRPGALDKQVGILKDAPAKEALKYNARTKGRSRRALGPAAFPPQSIFTKGTYEEPMKVLKTALLRQERPQELHDKEFEHAYPYHRFEHQPKIKPTRYSTAIRQRFAGLRTEVCPKDPADLKPLQY